MASIQVEFNTTEKTLEVTVDGKKLDNVDCVSVYKKLPLGYYGNDSDNDDDPEYCISITTCEEDEESGIHKRTHLHATQKLVAAESDEGKKALREGAKRRSDLPGLVIAEEGTNVSDFLQNFKNNVRRK